jgi:tetratricopeptide (TPR) repeat protein
MDTRARATRWDRRTASRLRPCGCALVGLLAVLGASSVARAQQAVPTDPVERSMYFIDKSAEATELLSQNKLQQALATFQDLAVRCPDLDEDGYVAMAIGDCLAGLGRDAEAQAAYNAAAASHPELAVAVNQRLIELELIGEVSDALIDRLRRAAAAPDKSRYAASWQLGRALQKRAKALLIEAAAAFRAVNEADAPFARTDPTLRHAAALDELANDLGSLIDQLDSVWGSARRAMGVRLPDRGETGAGQIVMEKQRSDWVIRAKDGRRIEFQMKLADRSDEAQCVANGKSVKLTATQRALIRRHEERINAILLQAVDEAGEAGRQAK